MMKKLSHTFKKLNNFEYIGTLSTMEIDLDLLKHALTIRMRILVDNLNSILHTGVDIATREHLTIRAST